METNEEKKEKPVKAPGALRKPIKKKRFASKFEKLLEHPGDKSFFISCFEERDDVFYIRTNITKDDVKRLKKLLKAIKENRKAAIKLFPIILVGGIIAAFYIFFTVFANPLLGKALEKGLESIFEARADVRSFRLSLIDFEIRVNRIIVANCDKPMTNLFELGVTKIKLKPAAILRGKLYIEEIRADTILFGTERKTSGAIPGLVLRKDKPKKEKPPKPEGPPLIDLKNFDAMALLNSEFDKLSTPKLYDLAINTYNETSEKWQKQVDDSTKRVKELQSNVKPLLNMNINNMRDIEAARKAIEDINKMVTTVQATTNDINTIVNGLENDIKTAQSLEGNARNSITNDLNHLLSYIDLGSGAAFAAIEPFIREMLSDTAEQYIDYGMIALSALQQLKGQSSNKKPPKPKKEKKVLYKGVDVHFPVWQYPSFYLGQVASDFTHNDWNWSFNLQNISSDPDFISHSTRANGPVTLAFGLNERGDKLQRSVGFNGSADFRTNRENVFSAKVDGNGFPLSISNQLDSLGIKGFKGETDFTVNITGFPNQNPNEVFGRVNMGGNVSVNQAQLIEPKGTIAEAVGAAVQKAGVVSLGLHYIDDKFSIDTTLAGLIEEAIRSIINTYKDKAIAEVERVLRQKISEYIDGKFVSKEQLDTLINIAKGDRAIIEQTKDELNKKINELQRMGEQQVKQVIDDATQMAEQAAQQAREEAERQAQAARAEADRQTQAAKAEAERQAQAAKEEAERKAKEEAQKQAEQAAKNVLPSLPGRR